MNYKSLKTLISILILLIAPLLAFAEENSYNFRIHMSSAGAGQGKGFYLVYINKGNISTVHEIGDINNATLKDNKIILTVLGPNITEVCEIEIQSNNKSLNNVSILPKSQTYICKIGRLLYMENTKNYLLTINVTAV